MQAAVGWPKRAVAMLAGRTHLSSAMIRSQSLLTPYLRAVNYHDVPPSTALNFEMHLRYFRRHYEPAGIEDVLDICYGNWNGKRRGLILCFDDGLRSHAEVVAPLLDRYGFSGFFFVPVGFVDSAPELQQSFAERNSITYAPHEWSDQRLAMTWDQVRRLSQHHVVGCHSFNHIPLSNKLSEGDLRREIVHAKRDLEDQIERECEAFCWVGRNIWSHDLFSAAAHRVISDAGFRVSFMSNHALIRPGCDPLYLQRSALEADFSLDLVRLQTSPVMDLRFAFRRRKVARLVADVQSRPA